MGLYSARMKMKRASVRGSYHNDIENLNSFFRRPKKAKPKPLGLTRTIFSGLSLSFGAMMCYVSMHYLPAFLQPQKILNSTAIDRSENRLLNKGPVRKIIGPYIDAFSIQRTYLRKGQHIEAQFLLPEGATLDLNMQQCQHSLIVEIFNCKLVSQKSLSLTDETLGVKTFKFEQTGFYHFDHKVTFKDGQTQDYKVVWIRR